MCIYGGESLPWDDFNSLVGENKQGGDFKICGNELILDIFELQMKSKKKVLSTYIGNFETYTRYSRIAGEKRS